MAGGENIRVLISNHGLAHRGGSELYVRDVAIQLKRRGHHPVAYSTVLGPVAEDLRAASVPTIDDLRLLKDEPDVIHGHHHLDAATAALRFPRVPAVHACHGWIPWQESPLILSSIRRYVAISDLTRESLLTSGVPPERITVIPNFVDLESFATFRNPPLRPSRALAYGNPWTRDAPALAAIREGCRRMGVEVEAIGVSLGNPVDRPELVLPNFDIVFGVGRCALEAAACGCAVVLASPAGFGGLVTSEVFSGFRTANFGHQAIAGGVTSAEAVIAALERYDARDVANVSQRVRNEAGIETAIDQWEALYRLTIAEGPAPLEQVVADTSTYLVKLKGLTGHFESGWHRSQHDVHALHSALATERAAFSALATERAAFAAERDASEANRSAAEDRVRALESRCAALSSESDDLRSALASVGNELKWLRAKPRGLKRVLKKMGLRS